MPAISNLNCRRRPLRGSFNVFVAPVPTDDLDFRMDLQPIPQGAGGTFRQEVYGTATFQIAEYSAVAMPFALCPIIDAQDTHRRWHGKMRLPDSSQQRIRTGGHGQP